MMKHYLLAILGLLLAYPSIAKADSDVTTTGFKYDFKYNLWKDAEVTVRSTWFADGGWSELSPQPTVELTPNKGFTFTAPKATGNDQWQGQVHIGTNISVKAGVTYDFSCNITVPKDGVVTVKPQMDGDNNVYFIADRVDVVAGDNIVWFSDVEGFDGRLKIAFDFAGFGGCDITVDNIVFKEHKYDDGTVIPNTNTDGLTFNILSEVDRTVEVVASPAGKYKGDIVIPSSVKIGSNTYKVVQIGKRAFDYCTELLSISIPSSVTTIGNSAFWGCRGLTEVSIPNSVTSIGYYAFSGCSGLTEIAIPTSVTSISEGAFENCSGLTEVTIPNSVTSIGYYAFSGCSGLTEVTIPNSVTSIGDYAFFGCSGLTKVTIPSSVTTINSNPFSSCIGLSEIMVDANSKSFTSKDGVLFTKDMSKLVAFPAGKTYVDIPNTVTRIGSDAFWGSIGLTEVTIPNSVSSIDDNAFSYCDGLTEVIIGNYVTTIGKYAFGPCHALASVIFGNSVTTIGDYAFFGCSGLTEVTIPNSVTSIGSRAFRGCTGLMRVYYAAKEPIEGPFDIFSDYTKPTLYVPEEAVEKCKKIDPWKNFVNIDAYDFSEDADELTYNILSVTDKTVEVVASPAGSYKGDIVIPSSVKIGNNTYKVVQVGNYAFGWCNELTSVTIPTSITCIGSGAFESCSSLTAVLIPNSVTSIGKWAFENCSGLTSVYYETKEPIEGSSNIFSDYTKPTLYVPEEAVEKCKKIDPWKNFAKIKAYDFSGVEDVTADIEGESVCEVYNLNGVRVANSTDNLAPGLYIVRQGSTVKKIIVN